MRRIPGVQGVRVSLNEGRTVVELGPGNTVTLGRVRTALKDGGFVSGEVLIEGEGLVRMRGAELIFIVSGTEETFVVAPGPNTAVFHHLGEKAQRGDVVVRPLKGRIAAPAKQADIIRLDAAMTP
jgi:hypothetical protein